VNRLFYFYGEIVATKQYVIDKIRSLPSPPAVLQQVAKVARDTESSVDDMVKVLRTDSVMGGKVLRLANSAYAGLPNSVGSLENAVVVLGMNRIYSLVLSSSIYSHLGLPHGFLFTDFQKHSFAVAAIGESVARYLKRYDSIDSSDIFCAGLLHDIGKLVMGTIMPEEFERIRAAMNEGERAFCEAEDEGWHCDAGGILAEAWNFPPVLEACIRNHHCPASAGHYKRWAAIIHVADAMAHVVGSQTIPHEKKPPLDGNVTEILGLPPERFRAITNEVLSDSERFDA